MPGIITTMTVGASPARRMWDEGQGTVVPGLA